MSNHPSRITSLERRRLPGMTLEPLTEEEQTEDLIGILNNPFIAEGAEGRLHPNLSPIDRAHAEKMLAEERAHVAEIRALLEAGESADDGPLAS